MTASAEPVLIPLVRHGQAAAGWGSDPDPGLSPEGRREAQTVAARLAGVDGRSVVSSPLRRCRETAEFITRPPGPSARTASMLIEARVAEIPSPADMPLEGRGAWLRDVLDGTWTDLGEPFTTYRQGVVDALIEMREATIVVSHFVAINAVIGHCTGDDRLVISRLDNCSVTTIANVDGRLSLYARGETAPTTIN